MPIPIFQPTHPCQLPATKSEAFVKSEVPAILMFYKLLLMLCHKVE